MNIESMVNSIAKTCESLNEDPRPYDEYTPEEQAAYDADASGAVGVGAYFDDVYDVNYYVNSNGDFGGVRLLVAFGGPTIYVDTCRREVAGSWGLQSASAKLSHAACDLVNAYFNEVYYCTH